MRIFGLWIFVVCAVWTGLPMPTEAGCLRNVYASTDTGCDTDANSEKPGKLLLLYSKTALLKRDPVQNLVFEMNSDNEVLSQGGPMAPAKLRLTCNELNHYRLVLNFPGYPLFGENDHLRIAMIQSNEVVYAFETMRGENIFDAVLDKAPAIRAILDHVAGMPSKTVTFSSLDQDGLRVSATFSKDVLLTQLGPKKPYCRG